MSDNVPPGRRYGYRPPTELSTDEALIHARIDALLDQSVMPATSTFRDLDLKRYEAGESLLAASPREQVSIVLAAISRLAYTGRGGEIQPGPPGDRAFDNVRLIQNVIIRDLLRKRLPVSEEEVIAMLRLLLDTFPNANYHYQISVTAILAAIERRLDPHGLSDAVRALLAEMLAAMGEEWDYAANGRKLRRRIERILSTGTIIIPGEAWTDTIIKDLSAMDPELRKRWEDLLGHAGSASAAAPSSQWLAQGRKHLAVLGGDIFTGSLVRWFPGVEKGAAGPMSDLHADLLRGLVWYCRLVDDPRIPSLVCDAGVACLKKIPGIGARSQKVGNACIRTLGALPGTDAIAQLSRMRLRVKNGSAINAINKALDAAAERTGLTREDMEEISVPRYGLDAGSRREDRLGSCTATIDARSGRALLMWQGSGGKTLKSVPAEVRREYPEELAAVKRLVKDLDTMLDAQRIRMERFFLVERSWPYAVWRERYLEHPLLAVHARRLIWRFIFEGSEQSGIWHNGEIVDHRGRPLEFPGDSPVVRLWSPIGVPVEEVLQWRIWLEGREIVQPFKQAHREVYILTDAERATGTYSNRFAGHILRQHQFAALCRERGWQYGLQGAFDSANTPTLDLPEWGLRAEFWVDSILDDDRISEVGMALYISTDQVRFYSNEERQYPQNLSPEEYRRRWEEWGNTWAPPLPLEQIPPPLFSEVMRDVDLFTGVCSVGTDPAWSDGGERGHTYWQTFSFGDLSATAQTRRDLLGRLIPRLKIAGRCTLQDRFLLVRGERRSYKIHLGSGNILMEPNDQYLCIVPARSGPEGDLFLPFEGDRMLSVILSKAFLLADDTKITDPTILSQIRL